MRYPQIMLLVCILMPVPIQGRPQIARSEQASDKYKEYATASEMEFVHRHPDFFGAFVRDDNLQNDAGEEKSHRNNLKGRKLFAEWIAGTEGGAVDARPVSIHIVTITDLSSYPKLPVQDTKVVPADHKGDHVTVWTRVHSNTGVDRIEFTAIFELMTKDMSGAVRATRVAEKQGELWKGNDGKYEWIK